jgi:hypothetical protein
MLREAAMLWEVAMLWEAAMPAMALEWPLFTR